MGMGRDILDDEGDPTGDDCVAPATAPIAARERALSLGLAFGEAVFSVEWR